jgi:hypothetical protein
VADELAVAEAFHQPDTVSHPASTGDDLQVVGGGDRFCAGVVDLVPASVTVSIRT